MVVVLGGDAFGFHGVSLGIRSIDGVLPVANSIEIRRWDEGRRHGDFFSNSETMRLGGWEMIIQTGSSRSGEEYKETGGVSSKMQSNNVKGGKKVRRLSLVIRK